MLFEKKTLPEGYSIRLLKEEEFNPFFHANRPKMFSETAEVETQATLSEEQLDLKRTLGKNIADIQTIHLGAFHYDKLIGWSFGRQIDDEVFYMVNSAIFTEHRRRGLYSALLSIMIVEAETLGFQIITSRHIASNNAVIIPKLKLGFVIAGLEISDQFGTLVKLAYYANPERKKIMQFRTGEIMPDENMRRLFDFYSESAPK